MKLLFKILQCKLFGCIYPVKTIRIKSSKKVTKNRKNLLLTKGEWVIPINRKIVADTSKPCVRCGRIK